MKIEGKGIIIVNVNGTTINYFPYEDNKELKDIVKRFYKIQNLKDITIIDCQQQMIYFVDGDKEYKTIMEL